MIQRLPRVKNEERQKIGQVFSDTAAKLADGTLNGRADAYAEIIAYTQPLMTGDEWKPLFLDLTEKLKAKELDDREKLAEALKVVGETISGAKVKNGLVSEKLADGVQGVESVENCGRDGAQEETEDQKSLNGLEEAIQDDKGTGVESVAIGRESDESTQVQDTVRQDAVTPVEDKEEVKEEGTPPPPAQRMTQRQGYYYPSFPAWGGMW